MFNQQCDIELLSGKGLHSYGQSPFSIGKSTINGYFSIATVVYQKVRDGDIEIGNLWSIYGIKHEYIKPIIGYSGTYKLW